jgi:hypothetical protein
MFIPAEAGPLDSPDGKSIVAHELTHVAHQHWSGGVLPPEDTAEGRQLEAEAQTAERFFRGDPGAPPPRASRSTGSAGHGGLDANTSGSEAGEAGMVHEAQALMRRLVADGAAVPDGSGGIVFTPPPPPPATAPPAWPGSVPGTQRQTGPAPRGSTASDAPARWNPLASLGHTLKEDFTALTQDMLVSELGLGEEAEDDFNRSRNDSERDFAKAQFAELRLEHRKAQVMSKHHGHDLGDTELASLKEEVDHEVEHRLSELTNRVQIRLDAINDQRSYGGRHQPAAKVLDPEQYRHLVHRLFGDPDGDVPPDDTDAIEAAKRHAQSHQHAATAAAGPTSTTTSITTSEAQSGKAGPASRGPATTDARSARASEAGTQNQRQRQSAGFSSWTDVEHSLVRDLVAADTAFLGMEFTDDELFGKAERKANLDRTASASTQKSAATAARGSRAAGGGSTGTGGSTASGAATTHEAGHNEGHGAASGQETIDLDHLDLDDLSSRIYGRLRSKLRLELLVDRERAGFLTDFR